MAEVGPVLFGALMHHLQGSENTKGRGGDTEAHPGKKTDLRDYAQRP